MPLIRQILSFGAVGLIATLTHVLIAGFAFSGGLHPALANLFGALAAFCVSFIGNSSVTFRSRRSFASTAPRYAVLTAASFGITTALMLWTESQQLPLAAYATAAIVIIPPTTFVLARFWVFAPKAAERSSDRRSSTCW